MVRREPLPTLAEPTVEAAERAPSVPLRLLLAGAPLGVSRGAALGPSTSKWALT